MGDMMLGRPPLFLLQIKSVSMSYRRRVMLAGSNRDSRSWGKRAASREALRIWRTRFSGLNLGPLQDIAGVGQNAGSGSGSVVVWSG